MPTSQQLSAHLAPNTLFNDRYQIGRLLGRGGMGSVYHAKDLTTTKDVALKVPACRTADAVASFAREVAIHAHLHSPHIVEVVDSCTIPEDGPLYIALEYLEGRSLADVIGSAELPSVATRIQWLTQVARALEYIHAQGIIHCDITPGNVLISSAGAVDAVKLLDFGAAVRVSEHSATDQSAAIGTLYYMSPEQHRGKSLDARSDIYSLGVLAYELLTGEKAFELQQQYEEFLEAHHLKLRHLAGRIPSVREKNPTVSRFLSTMVQVCMQKKRQYRYDSTTEIAQKLEHALRVEVNSSPLGRIRRLFF